MPAVQLSYADSEEYCAWAVGLYGEKRLPTEYEWEYAARGGLQNQSYPWGEFKSEGSGRCNRVIRNDTCSKNRVTVNLIFGSDKEREKVLMRDGEGGFVMYIDTDFCYWKYRRLISFCVLVGSVAKFG